MTVDLGKATDEEIQDLFAEMLEYLDLSELERICREQLDPIDYKELKSYFDANR